METTNGMLLGEGHPGPEAALPWVQGWQHLEGFSPFPAHIFGGPQPRAETPALLQGPLGQNPSAKLPSANNITSAPSGIQPATVPKASRCWAKLEAPGPSIFHSKGSAQPRQPTLT
jgi:hypothetical protein